MKKYLMILILSSSVNFGCYYDKEEQLYGLDGPCNVSNVSYSATIIPLFQMYGCVGCHSGVSASGGVRLDGYTNVKTYVLNGKLMGSIIQSSGFSAMPKGGNKMLSCDINKIKAWIDSGSLNN